MSNEKEVSTKPYLIRAIHEWCVDHGYTPYLAVAVNGQTRVPLEHVRGGQIILNVSPYATNKLQLGNDWIEFQARFGGQVRDLLVPVEQVAAIYARENGQGMAFEVFASEDETSSASENEVNLMVVSSEQPQELSPELAVEGDLKSDSELNAADSVEKNDTLVEKNLGNASEKRKSHLTRVK